jgi:hypothetical protein
LLILKIDFALAAGATLTLANYFLVGWFNGQLDQFYMESWKVFVSLIAVFNIFGNISLAILRHRLSEKSLLSSLAENFKCKSNTRISPFPNLKLLHQPSALNGHCMWRGENTMSIRASSRFLKRAKLIVITKSGMPMFSIFFGGLSLHLTCAILAHLFSIDMQWGATSKEKENSNFWKEIPKIFATFKWMYMIILILVGGMIYLGFFAPRGWEIRGVTAVVPMAITLGSHALVPFLLNPSLMIFSY